MKKKIDTDKLREQQRHPSGRKTFKDALDSKVLGPLFVGLAIGMVGLIFEQEPLSWIGTGLMGYGFFQMVRTG